MINSQTNKMARLFIIVAVIISLLAPALSPAEVHAAAGNTYYVSSSDGNDDNDGLSASKPWKSLDKVNSQKFQPGDHILFKAGDVWSGFIKLRSTSGTKEAPIVFDKYGSSDPDVRPIINGNGTTTTEQSAIIKNYSSVSDKMLSATIDVVDGSYLEFHNFELTNQNPNVVSQRAGINIRTASTSTTEWEANPHRGIVIKNNYVHDVDGNPKGWKMGSGGILILGNISDVLVEGNIVKRVDIEGIRNAGLYKEGDVNANFPRVLENIIFNNNYVEETQGDAFVMSNVGKNGRMEYNTVVKHSAKNVGNVNYAGLWVIGVKDMVMQYNEVYGGVYGYNDGQAFDIDMFCEGTLYQYNYSHSNRGGFILFMGGSKNSLVRYNVSVNDGDGRYIFHYLPTTSGDAPLIHNNTFFIDSNIKTRLISDPGKYVRLYNNIFYSKANTTFGQDRFAGGEVKKNIFYPGSGYKDANLTGISLDDNLFVSPQFARAGEEPKDIINMNDGTFDVEKLNGYKLLPGSPAIDAGMDMTALTPSVWQPATKDFFNNTLAGPVDIGAHEYSSDAPAEVNREVMPTSLTVDHSELTFTADNYGATLTATTLPADAWFKGVKWSSSNPSVATVDANGYVLAVSEGTAVITAENVADPNVKAAVNVTSVTPISNQVLHLKFDDNAKDSSPYHQSVTTAGSLNFAKGFAGKAVDLGASGSSYLSAGNPAKLQFGASTNFTIAFWMKSGTQGGADTTIISNKDWASGANQGWVIGMDKGNLTWNYKGSNINRLDLKPTAVTVGDDQWHHVVVTHNRTGNAVIYVDNKAVKSVSIAGSGNVDTSYPINIGADGKGNLPYKGLLDDMKIYTSALSEAEVSALYNSYFAEPGDRTALQEAIEQALEVHNAAVAGTKPGEYPAAAKQALKESINAAQAVLIDEAAAPEAIDAATMSVTSAVAAFQATVNKPRLESYVLAADDVTLSDDKKTVDLRIDGQMNDGSMIDYPPYYKVEYHADHPDAVIDPLTGKLTFNGDLSSVNKIGVTAAVEEYTDLIYSESFENGWGDFVTEANPPTNGSGGKISNAVSYHGEYSARFDEPPAVEKVFAPNQQGVVTMMLYDDGSKAGTTRAVAHVGNLRTDLMAAMGVFFDGGKVGDLDYYSVRTSNSATAWEKTAIPRTKGWHELKWDYTSGTDLKMYIDNQLVKTTTAIKSFDRINLAFIWDKANGRTFAFDNIKYAASNAKTVYETNKLNLTVDKPNQLSTTLTGPESIQQGNSFTLKYGLSHVDQSIFAQYIILNYDANLFEYVKTAPLSDGIEIIEPEQQKAGEIKLIVASLGAGKEITGDGEFVELTFKAKEAGETATGVISIVDATVGDNQGEEAEAALTSHSIELIAKDPGMPGDFNGDEKVSIGDLAMIAAHYGKNDESPDWDVVKKYDIVRDGVIDIKDLAAIAQLIIGK